jgi:hypothetical protein
MRILYLTLKGKWFDMIAAGIKKEEYREIKPYWENRFIDQKKQTALDATTESEIAWKGFDAVFFKNGYSKEARSMLVEFKGFDIGSGYPHWGGGNETFILKLGEIINPPSKK